MITEIYALIKLDRYSEHNDFLGHWEADTAEVEGGETVVVTNIVGKLSRVNPKQSLCFTEDLNIETRVSDSHFLLRIGIRIRSKIFMRIRIRILGVSGG